MEAGLPPRGLDAHYAAARQEAVMSVETTTLEDEPAQRFAPPVLVVGYDGSPEA